MQFAHVLELGLVLELELELLPGAGPAAAFVDVLQFGCASSFDVAGYSFDVGI